MLFGGNWDIGRRDDEAVERSRELEKRGREGLNNTYLWEEREFY